MVGIWWRRWQDVIGDGRDKGKLEVEVVEDAVMYGSEVLEFELDTPGTKPFEEGDFVVMQERSLKDVSDPLALLCVHWQVVNMTRNGRLTYVGDICNSTGC